MIMVFDIDGTLANNDHREHYLDGDNKDWDNFFADAHLDTVHEGIAQIAQWAWDDGVDVVLLTGRPWRTKQETETWLARHHIEYDQLIIRPEGCREDDSTLKVRLLEENFTAIERADIATIFEDRRRVVDGLRGAGYHVCHVAEGDF